MLVFLVHNGSFKFIRLKLDVCFKIAEIKCTIKDILNKR